MLLSWMCIAVFIFPLVTIESKEDKLWSTLCYEKMLVAYKEINSFDWTEYAENLTLGKDDIGWVVKVPHLDAKEYIDTLIAYVCRRATRTLIVGGPKDIGKSMGISFVRRSALKAGFTVFQMNLKGKIEEVDIKKVVYDLSWDITEMMMNVEENKEMACMLEQVQLCHIIKQSWKLPYQYFVEYIHYWIPAVVSILSLSVVLAMWSSLRHVIMICLSKHLKLSLSLAVLMIALLSYVQWPWYFIQIKYFLLLIQTRASEGDWSTMFCCLNSIKHCTSNGPILIIRDVKNLQPQRLHNLFSILESRKERNEISDKIDFPTIVETSDNLWMNKLQSDSAKMAFKFYYLNPMSYNDGKKELVDKFSLFNESLYKNLYNEWFGGHMRFYLEYWVNARMGMSHDQIIDELFMEATEVFKACRVTVTEEELQHEIMSLFKLLKQNNFALEALWLSKAMKHLIECNMLYYASEKLVVQNRFLEVVIERAISMKKTIS